MGFATQGDSEALIKWGRSASPLVVNTSGREQVVVPMGGKANSETPITLVSMELRTGSVLWKQGAAQIGYASPALIQIGSDQFGCMRFAAGFAGGWQNNVRKRVRSRFEDDPSGTRVG